MTEVLFARLDELKTISLNTNIVSLIAFGIPNGIIAQTIYGGKATNSTLTLQSTNNGAPSGDSVTILGATINLRSSVGGASTVNIGGANQTNGVLTIAGTVSGSVALNAV